MGVRPQLLLRILAGAQLVEAVVGVDSGTGIRVSVSELAAVVVVVEFTYVSEIVANFAQFLKRTVEIVAGVSRVRDVVSVNIASRAALDVGQHHVFFELFVNRPRDVDLTTIWIFGPANQAIEPRPVVFQEADSRRVLNLLEAAVRVIDAR